MTAADYLPARATISSLRRASKTCEGCDLCYRGTQTVFGEGPANARVVMVGEQPGDQEDLAGRPFVGPAGALLDRALLAAGLDRTQVYVTNAVKHFKWEQRGKRRLHARPNSREIEACKPWLEAELKAIKPELLVVLGSVAAQSLLGRKFKVTQERGKFIESPWAVRTLATFHPSALLRAPDHDARAEMNRLFVTDLRKVAKALANSKQTAN
jgi:uracil-DNA glycosylase family protein